MEKKFIKLFEATLSRYTRGGFLTSDRVKFIDKALTHDFIKNAPEETKLAIKGLIDSGVNLRVRNVKSHMPAVMGAGNPDDFGYSFNIEVVPEIAPGLYDVNKAVTVPSTLLVRHADYPNLPPVPDSMKYDNKVQIKPEEVEINDDKTMLTPKSNTHLSDVGGNKLEAGDRELKNVNVKIPSEPAVGHKDPATYTAQYLPKS
jgi:hypothetical protein